jgi:hypothetical protein
MKEVLKELHGRSSEYICVNRTLEKARQWYYWIHMRSELTDGAQCDTCSVCQGL